MKKVLIITLQVFLLVLPILLGTLWYLYNRYESQFNYDVINLENRSGIYIINQQPAIKTFFTTNRVFDVNASPNYTHNRSEKLNYGVTYVPIPKQYRFGGVFDNSQLLKVDQFNEATFFRQLKQAIADSKSKLLVIWVHGYANSFSGSASVLARGAYDLNTEATYLFFSWPSQYQLFSYAKDEETEKKSAPVFAQFLKQLHEKIPEAKLVIIGHSLGTRLICDSFDILYREHWSDLDNEIQDVIMIAPDVDENDFDHNFRQHILTMVKRLTVYVASDDNALLLSHIEFGNKPLGLPTEFNHSSHVEETQALMAIMSNQNSHYDIIDATYITKPGFLKHRYYRSRAIISDIYWLLNNFPSNKRQLYRSKLNPKHNYWVLPP